MVITKNQCEIGDKLDEANRLSKQRNEILNRKQFFWLYIVIIQFMEKHKINTVKEKCKCKELIGFAYDIKFEKGGEGEKHFVNTQLMCHFKP